MADRTSERLLAQGFEDQPPEGLPQRLRALLEIDPEDRKILGLAPNQTALEGLIHLLAVHWPQAPEPVAVRATWTGDVEMEWAWGEDGTLTLRVDLQSQRAHLLRLDSKGQTCGEFEANLAHDRGWLSLICEVTGDPTAGRQHDLFPVSQPTPEPVRPTQAC